MSPLTLVLGVIAGAMMLTGVAVLVVTLVRGRLNNLGSYLISGGVFVLAAALASHLFG